MTKPDGIKQLQAKKMPVMTSKPPDPEKRKGRVPL
jgi:hypothetical protein